MSVDKLVDSTQLDSDLTSVANAIRSKTGGSVSLTFPAEFVSAINGITTGGNLETGSQTITATESSQSIQMLPSTGYDGFDEVDITVNAIPSNYVGSGVTQRTSADLFASGATVTAPAGYYASSASKAVASGSATTPATTITANPSISVFADGSISSSVSASKIVTPTVTEGYVSAGTGGYISVSGSNTHQLTTLSARTYHPATADRTISRSQYLIGNQTIKGVLLTNLTAENIALGVTVKVGDSDNDQCITSVTGTHGGGGGGYVDVTSQATYMPLATPHIVLFDSSTHKVLIAGKTESGPAIMGGLDISMEFGGGTMGNDDMGFYASDAGSFYSNATLTNGAFDFPSENPMFNDLFVLLSFTATGGGSIY